MKPMSAVPAISVHRCCLDAVLADDDVYHGVFPPAMIMAALRTCKDVMCTVLPASAARFLLADGLPRCHHFFQSARDDARHRVVIQFVGRVARHDDNADSETEPCPSP